ncbi:MAG: carbohydrate kinase family protein [Patescibacteria group bacterium]|nr:carbohydrate kinase family protein [Patescibacteria group bacterium]
MNQKFDLLTIGDVSMDVFMLPEETETLCQLNSKECLICFSYGDKIPVRNLEFCLGGNAANNAVGTTRLGIKTALVATLGGDLIGNQVVEILDREKVDQTYVIQQPTAGTNYSTIINYGGERTIFSYHAPRSYEFPVALPDVAWVYLTSMGETFTPFYNHFLNWLVKHPNVKLAFNPGSRQLRVDISVIKPVLERCELIYVNREEAQKLTSLIDTYGDEKSLLLALTKLGPRTAVITDGLNGAFAFDGLKYLKVGVLPVESYERTGAGDAFGSGCLSAIIKGKSFSESLLWGAVNSASVIGYVGAQKGLLNERDMITWLERAKSSGVEVVEI